jgi:PAS domain S-box-containing protein
MSVSRKREASHEAHLGLLEAHEAAGVAHAVLEGGKVIACNEALSRLCGAELKGVEVEALARWLPRSRRLTAAARGESAAGGGHEETTLVHADGTRVPVELWIQPVAGRPGMVVMLVRDVTDRKRSEALRQRLVASRAAQQAVDDANRRLAFLARASAVLQATSDLANAVDHVCRLAVPGLADWMVVEQLDPRAPCGLAALASVHVDPGRAHDIRELRNRRGPWSRSSLAERAMEERRAVFIPSVEEAKSNALLESPEEVEILARLRLRTLLVAPVLAGDRALGVITLARRERRPYAASDLEMAEDLGRRIGAAIEQARMLAMVREATEARERFMLAASHELRTPVCALLLRLGVMRRDLGRHPEAEAALASSLEASLQQAERLSRLVDQMLDTAKVSSGELTVKPRRRELMGIVDRVLRRLRPWAERQGCELTVTGPKSVHGTWDPERVEQIVDSLLSNAIKFGAGAAVQLVVQPTEDHVVLQAIDEGIGIPDEELESVFDRWGDAAPRGDATGMRLGLYLARELVEAHGGTIEVVSTRGCGTTFTVRLPYTRRERQSAVRLTELLAEGPEDGAWLPSSG